MMHTFAVFGFKSARHEIGSAPRQHSTGRHMLTLARRVVVAAVIAFGFVVALTAPSANAAYPERPITMVIAYPPGGGADTLGRVIARQLETVLKQSVVVVNRSGAGGTIGAASVANSPADGYTIFFAESSLLVAPHMYASLPFDLKRFTPVASVGALPFAIVSSPNFPAKNLNELISLIKSKPGQYSYASPGVGNIGHLTAELFQKLAGTKLVHIPYQGGGKLVGDVMSGEVPLSFISVSPILPLVKAGKMNLIAVTSAARAPFAPETQTVSEVLPGFATATNFYVLAPAALPVEIRNTLADAVRKTLRTKEASEAFAAQGASLSLKEPDDVATEFFEESDRWGRIVKEAAIKPQ